MTTSRRSFFQLVSLNGLAVAAGACAPKGSQIASRTSAPTVLKLDSNENSNGPGPRVLAAIQEAFGEVNRYPFQAAGRLTDAIATAIGVTPNELELGCGSSEILDAAVLAFTAPDRALVTASPTFELTADLARHLGRPVIEVPVTDRLQLDLGRMAEQATGAGLIYLCNPNNPTGTLHGGTAIQEFVAEVGRHEPRATILVDEAYHEYVERSDYRSAIPLALSNPRVVVSRTFSKIYGLAGLRIGYAVGQRETLREMSKHLDALRISRLSSTAALSALGDPGRAAEQRHMNRATRTFTARVFREAGYESIDSEANFLMVNVRRDIRAFQGACRDRGVAVARPFPPLLTYARITIGTMEEMTRAAAVFRDVLALPASTASFDLQPVSYVRDVGNC
jgi:histidinol-phosphate aminotransferase